MIRFSNEISSKVKREVVLVVVVGDGENESSGNIDMLLDEEVCCECCCG